MGWFKFFDKESFIQDSSTRREALYASSRTKVQEQHIFTQGKHTKGKRLYIF